MEGNSAKERQSGMPYSRGKGRKKRKAKGFKTRLCKGKKAGKAMALDQK